MATLSEKVDDIRKKSIADDEGNQGAESSAPSHTDEGENVTDGDTREEEEEEQSSDDDDDEVGEQRFVDHTYYRHKIGE